MHTSLATLPNVDSPTSPAGIAPCANPECGKLTRSSKMKSADYPDTIARGGGGMCVTCWNHSKAPRQDSNPLKAIQFSHTMAGLGSFMEARRRRGVPAEGLRYECSMKDAA